MNDPNATEDKKELLKELSLALARVTRLKLKMQAAGRTQEAAQLEERAKAMGEQVDTLTKELLQEWRADANDLARQVHRQNAALKKTLDELKEDLADAEIFTKAIGLIDDILRLSGRLT